DHALEAFDAHAVDYLLKPVREERLRAALEKAQRLVRTRSSVAGVPRERRSHLCARLRGDLLLVPIADVHYLIAEDKYVVVHHDGGEVLVEESLKALEEEFAGRFVRIHRNCLVARARLAGLQRGADGRGVARIAGRDVALEVRRRSLPALRAAPRAR